MPATYEQIRARVLQALTAVESANAVVYLTKRPVESGALDTVSLTSPAWVAFVDREPLANWGHSCRYLVIDRNGRVLGSLEARFPPFPAASGLGWRLASRAPTVPDTALLIATDDPSS